MSKSEADKGLFFNVQTCEELAARLTESSYGNIFHK